MENGHVSIELTAITVNDEELNNRQEVIHKDVAVQADLSASTLAEDELHNGQRPISKDVLVQTELTAIMLDDEETYFQRQVMSNDIGIQAELTAMTINQEQTNDEQHAMSNDDQNNSESSHELDELQLNMNEEEILDQEQLAVTTDSLTTVPNISVTKNCRIVDDTTEETNLKTTNTVNKNIVDVKPVVGYANEPLLPLSKACLPLNSILHNLSFYIQMALDETPEQPPNGLTVDESAAIRLYTIEWDGLHRSLYSMLNRTLESNNRENLRPYYKYMKLFLTALAKLPCVPPLTIWRGLTKNVSAEFPPGTPVTWWGFSSCTTELTVLESELYLGNTGNRTLFSVEAINARTVRAHSHFVVEDEILLLPGTHMIVQSQFSPAPDLHIIHLKQIPPEEILLEPPFEGNSNSFNRLFSITSMSVFRCTSLSKNWVSLTSLFPSCIFNENFHYISRRPWYRKKRFIIPISLFTLMCIGAIILGSVLGSRTTIHITNTTGMFIDKFFTNEVKQLEIFISSKSFMILIVPSFLVPACDKVFEPLKNYKTRGIPNSATVGHFINDSKLDMVVLDNQNKVIFMLPGNGDGTFLAPWSYTVGKSPQSVISADFSNDNKLDLAVVSSGDDTLSVLLGNGNGIFQTAIKYTVGRNPQSAISADLNNDNKLDLVVVNFGDNTVSVLLGDGKGMFQTAMNYMVGRYPHSITSADFNNDIKTDLIITNYLDSTISVLLGNGNATFQNPMIYSVGRYPQSVTSADFNDDSKLDLAVANDGDNTISVLLGNGNGFFQAQINYLVGSGPSSIISADVNSDKKLDLVVVVIWDNNVSVLLGNGNGTFQTSMNYAVGRRPQSVISADFNNDSKLDLAVANGEDDSVSVLLGNGNGIFQILINCTVGRNPVCSCDVR